MNLNETLNELFSLTAKGIKLGLENITSILELMGNPQDNYKIIHIAGTNGKGSTASIVEGAFLEAGYKVGKYTSPHIVDFNERIVVNTVQISDEEICAKYRAIKDLIDANNLTPTFFEITTAMMFEYFKDQKCEYVVLETGLGGRFDATNVCKPEVSIITNVSLDHTGFLGNTLDSIAFEKCGIIKDKPVVIADSKIELLKAVENKTSDYIDVLKKYSKRSFELLDDFSTNITIKDENNKDITFNLSLYGEYQVNNFLGAYEALKIIGISDEIIKTSASKITWPGRFEIFQNKNPLVILDGAHNVDAAYRLKNNILSKYNKDDVISIVSILEDKDREGILGEISQLSSDVIFTSLTDFHRGTTGDSLLNLNSDFINQIVENDIVKAYKLAKNSNKIIIICGSFYLLSKFKQSIKTR